MVRSGGTECTPEELNASMPFNTLPAIFETCLDVFTRQNFQESDLKKIMKVTNEQQKKTDATSEELVTPWDVYLHVAVSLLHWDIAFFS